MESAGLLLSEEFYLLAFIDPTWKRPFLLGGLYLYGLAGALLADLSMAGRLDLDEQEKVVVDPTPTGDTLLDTLAAIIVASDTRLLMEQWFSILMRESVWNHTATRMALVRRMKDRLVARSILERTERRALGVFTVKGDTIVDDAVRQRTITRLRAILDEDVAPDVGTVMLLSVVRACDCLRWMLTPDELRRSERRIEEVLTADLLGKAVRAAWENETS